MRRSSSNTRRRRAASFSAIDSGHVDPVERGGAVDEVVLVEQPLGQRVGERSPARRSDSATHRPMSHEVRRTFSDCG